CSSDLTRLLHSAPCGNCDLLARRDQLCSLISDSNLSQLAKVLIRGRRIFGGFSGTGCTIQRVETVWGKLENSLVLCQRFLCVMLQEQHFSQHLPSRNYGSWRDRVFVHTLFEFRRGAHQRDCVRSLAVFL